MNKSQAFRTGIIAVSMLCASLPVGAQPICSANTTQGKPNIVVIMTDDLDVGVLTTLIEHGLAPNIEAQFVDQGTYFANFYVTDSSCCPSRATFLTGQYAHNHGADTGPLRLMQRTWLQLWLGVLQDCQGATCHSREFDGP